MGSLCVSNRWRATVANLRGSLQLVHRTVGIGSQQFNPQGGRQLRELVEHQPANGDARARITQRRLQRGNALAQTAQLLWQRRRQPHQLRAARAHLGKQGAGWRIGAQVVCRPAAQLKRVCHHAQSNGVVIPWYAGKQRPLAIVIIGGLITATLLTLVVLPALYGFFSKLYIIFGMADKSEAAVKPFFYNNSYAAKEALATAKMYGYDGVERALLLLHEYNLKSVGVNDTGTSDGSLLKEMVVKMMG